MSSFQNKAYFTTLPYEFVGFKRKISIVSKQPSINFYSMLAKYSEWVEKRQAYPSNKPLDMGEYEIANWSHQIRYNQYRLIAEEKQSLDDLYFWYWDDIDLPFMIGYIKAFKWVTTNGKMPRIHGKCTNEEKPIGSWCGTQRMKYKNTNLSEFCIKKLERIPTWYWDGNSGKDMRPFEDKLNDLIQWQQSFGELPHGNPSDTNENKLAGWCDRRREDRNAGRLSKHHEEELEGIEGWYWAEKAIIRSSPIF